MCTTNSRFLVRRRGYFYFTRQVPTDLIRHYKQPRIVLSLRTKTERAAVARAASMARKLESDWLALR